MLDPMEAFATALLSERGIKIRCDDPVAYKQKLYAVRKHNPEFASISLHISRTDPANEIWLLKGGTHAPEEAGDDEAYPQSEDG